MFRKRIKLIFLVTLAVLAFQTPLWAAKRWKPKWTKAHPGWKTHRSKNFDFYYAPDSRITQYKFLETFVWRKEEGRRVICDYLQITDRRRIKIFIYDNNEVARKIIGQNAGFAQATVGIIHTRINQTIGHELTHVLSRAINGRPPPNRILDEGLAVFLDLTRRDYFATGQKLLREDKLPTIKQMLKQSKTRSEDWYPVAGTFVGFLCNQYGIKKFKRLWGSRERTFDKALRKVYKKSLRRIEWEWREYLRSYKPDKNKIPKPALPQRPPATKTAPERTGHLTKEERDNLWVREAGPKPSQSKSDATVEPVVKYLRAILNDPSNLKFENWSSVFHGRILVNETWLKCWGVRVDYRAKNAFGEYVRKHQVFYIRYNKVVKVKDLTNWRKPR